MRTTASDRGSLRGPAFAIAAAVTSALSVPLGKLLLGEIGSFTLAGTVTGIQQSTSMVSGAFEAEILGPTADRPLANCSVARIR